MPTEHANSLFVATSAYLLYHEQRKLLAIFIYLFSSSYFSILENPFIRVRERERAEAQIIFPPIFLIISTSTQIP